MSPRPATPKEARTAARGARCGGHPMTALFASAFLIGLVINAAAPQALAGLRALLGALGATCPP